MNEYNNIILVIDDLESMLNSLFISGLAVINDGVIKNIEEIQKECKNIGLVYAAETLDTIRAEIIKKRHNITFSSETLIKEYCMLNAYVHVIKNRVMELKVKENISKGEGE